jgi:hypothetical protein
MAYAVETLVETGERMAQIAMSCGSLVLHGTVEEAWEAAAGLPRLIENFISIFWPCMGANTSGCEGVFM